MIKNSPSLWQLAKKSIWLDWEFLFIRKLSLVFRLSFIVRKNLAAAQIILFKHANLKINSKASFELENLNDLGTLQTVIWDFYQTVAISNKIINKPNPVIIDVGGNIGQFSFTTKLFYPQAKVQTFEPDPVIFKKLKKHLKKIGGIEFSNTALSNQSGQLTFYRKQVSLVSTLEKPEESEGFEKIQVEAKKGNDMLKNYKEIDLLKIDVEGHEYSVIQGCQEVLKKSKFLLIEISLERETQPDNLELLKLIKQNCPHAKILRTGRVLNGLDGNEANQSCQDFLIKLY